MRNNGEDGHAHEKFGFRGENFPPAARIFDRGWRNNDGKICKNRRDDGDGAGWQFRSSNMSAALFFPLPPRQFGLFSRSPFFRAFFSRVVDRWRGPPVAVRHGKGRRLPNKG